MSATESVVKFLSEQTIDGLDASEVYGQKVPETAGDVYLWVNRGTQSMIGNLDSTDSVYSIGIDVEAVSVDGERPSADIINDVRDLLAGVDPGAFGYGFLNSIKVDDVADDYQIKNESADERVEVSAVVATLYLYQELD